MSRASYNENDPFAAQWLRNLIAAGHIMEGIVDDRPIQELRADGVQGADRAHFFAGIGGWDLALQLAGWPDARPVWTGSCPCQPFSQAGRRRGVEDERHLWPVFFRLIRECRPATVFGEQVASKDGLAWLDGVSADLEAEGYAVGAADLCAASLNAPHIRQRLFWVAHLRQPGLEERQEQPSREERQAVERGGDAGWMADAVPTGRPERRPRTGKRQASGGRGVDGLANSDDPNLHGRPSGGEQPVCDEHGQESGGLQHPVHGGRDGRPHDERWEAAQGIASPWGGAGGIACTDGKTRRVEPSVQPLAHGVPARMGRLRGYGNAIVPQVAAQFVKAFLDAERMAALNALRVDGGRKEGVG